MSVNIDYCPNGPTWNHDWSEGPTCRACGGTLPDTATQFAQRLEALLNRHSQENASDTPDFILAQFLLNCLAAWNQGVQQRETWYGRDPRPAVLAASGGSGPAPVDP
jgi:hypothetical protein